MRCHAKIATFLWEMAADVNFNAGTNLLWVVHVLEHSFLEALLLYTCFDVDYVMQAAAVCALASTTTACVLKHDGKLPKSDSCSRRRGHSWSDCNTSLEDLLT